jgi:hypothetical protein
MRFQRVPLAHSALATFTSSIKNGVTKIGSGLAKPYKYFFLRQLSVGCMIRPNITVKETRRPLAVLMVCF